MMGGAPGGSWRILTRGAPSLASTGMGLSMTAPHIRDENACAIVGPMINTAARTVKEPGDEHAADRGPRRNLTADLFARRLRSSTVDAHRTHVNLAGATDAVVTTDFGFTMRCRLGVFPVGVGDA